MVAVLVNDDGGTSLVEPFDEGAGVTRLPTVLKGYFGDNARLGAASPDVKEYGEKCMSVPWIRVDKRK
jgi:hypothetical protein